MTAIYITQQIIGAYLKGEIPQAVQVTFKDDAGTVLDLSGFTAQFEIIRIDGGTDPGNLGQGTPSIPTPLSGLTQYVWHANDLLTVGMYRGIMWVGDGTNRYGSEFFEWFVRDSLTTVPSI